MNYLLTLFLIILVSVATSLASERELPNPWEEYSKISEGDYLSPVTFLKSQEEAYLKSKYRDSYLQGLATYLSFVGRYDEAQKYFDEIVSSGNEWPVPEDLSAFRSEEAVPSLLMASQNRQVIMINEAHHVPETRALTFALLKPLYDRGFRYLAAETFTVEGIASSTSLGFPIRHLGYYTAEPLFADIAREALKIGFKLVAYEYTEPCDYEHFPNECQDKRERGEAQNLIDRVLKKDPKAKILVHAGYGHIDKLGGSSPFPWIPMAKYFKDFSGIDPFSIDQVEFRSRSKLAAETKGYRKITDHFQIKTLSVLRSGENLWSAMPEHYDVQVILPPSLKKDQYPAWAEKLFSRRKIKIKTNLCSEFPCLVEAALVGEAKEKYLPFHQIYLESKRQKVSLLLSTGRYLISFKSKKGTNISRLLVP